jgi:hypothetical protein
MKPVLGALIGTLLLVGPLTGNAENNFSDRLTSATEKLQQTARRIVRIKLGMPLAAVVKAASPNATISKKVGSRKSRP